jgi:hypothetical protein
MPAWINNAMPNILQHLPFADLELKSMNINSSSEHKKMNNNNNNKEFD